MLAARVGACYDDPYGSVAVAAAAASWVKRNAGSRFAARRERLSCYSRLWRASSITAITTRQNVSNSDHVTVACLLFACEAAMTDPLRAIIEHVEQDSKRVRIASVVEIAVRIGIPFAASRVLLLCRLASLPYSTIDPNIDHPFHSVRRVRLFPAARLICVEIALCPRWIRVRFALDPRWIRAISTLDPRLIPRMSALAGDGFSRIRT